MLCKRLKKKYRINDENFLGHSDIAPLRKTDPGEKFPWKKLSKFRLGKWYENSKQEFSFININKKKVKSLFFNFPYTKGAAKASAAQAAKNFSPEEVVTLKPVSSREKG